jgi:hypothetical protein
MKKELDERVSFMLDLMCENLKDDYSGSLEGFEQYKARLNCQLTKNVVQFKERFAKGYKILTDEIRKNHADQ